jgi:hypothetical protein
MPRSRITRGKFRAEVLSNGLIASAANLTIKPSVPRKVKKQEWQEQAWYWYDVVEVFHYAVQWIGNTISRATLVALEDGAPTKNQVALDALESFFGGSANHGEFLRQSSVHFTVAGGCYTVAEEVDGEDQWQVVAEVDVRIAPDGTYKVFGEEVDDDLTFIMRSWRPHPRKNRLSDSPARPLLPILSILDELTKYTAAQLDSRLAGAGLLLLPLEVSFPTPAQAPEGQEQQTGLDAFIQDLGADMMAAKKDRGDSSSVVPTIVQMPGEWLDKVQHLTFWSELDEHVSTRETEAIRRLALGLDMPADSLEGGRVNHWGAAQIDDSLIKSHAEPLLELICAAVAEGYLRVILEEGGMSSEDAANFSVGYDDAGMRLRPNRSKEALEMWDRGELNGMALRRENGFEEDDAMSDDERKEWLLLKLAQGSPSPELVEAAARELGIEIKTVPVPDGQDSKGVRPLPRSLEEHPVRKVEPDTRDAAAAALLATAEAAVFRALERCGNRLKSSGCSLAGVPTVTAMDRYQFVQLSKEQLSFVLEDAWSNLGRYDLGDFDVQKLETHLDNYTRMLITSQREYNRDLLAKYLGLVA